MLSGFAERNIIARKMPNYVGFADARPAYPTLFDPLGRRHHNVGRFAGVLDVLAQL
jgi:hypothetical protein